MAVSFRSKILLVKTETTYGVDSVPTGAANAVQGVDVQVMPMMGEDKSRDLDLPYFGAQPTVPNGLHAKITFKVELAPSGTPGTAPAWGPILRACGVAQTIVASTSVTYNPVTAGHESVTIYLYIGATLYRILGARGTCTLTVGAQDIPMLAFELTGLFTTPAEGARPTPVLTAWQRPLVASMARTPVFTVAGTALVLRSLALDFGNQVETRFLIGSESVLITDRADALSMTVEAEPMSLINPYTLAANQTPVAVVLTHGTVAGARATLNVPTAQMQRPEGVEGNQNLAEWPLKLVPLAAAGNDQWTLVLT